ncbi:hypothetical protein [uncultured Eudoraea sp.]|uniref:hypothetical protein n=1 Tax=uncultured Eudoraea sp. TaxID=1035614 RepID=UPI00260D95A9|nr:hypothetical protein [uncultured Eudoraea sp.]
MFLKKIFTILFFFSALFAQSQSNSTVGEYFKKLGGEEHLIEYTLTLREDGTFTFHFHRDHKASIPVITNKYGKGTWSMDGKVVSFFANEQGDFDEKHTLDFNNSRARFITKSPRDKTDRVIKTRLKFFESEIFWIEGLEIIKI